MTLKELKKSATRAVRKWCNLLPDDGDYREPELISDRMNVGGDGDYALIVIFHNRNDEQKKGGEWPRSGKGEG